MAGVPLSDFVRSAIREKAQRELAAVEQRAHAIEVVLSLRDALRAVVDQQVKQATALAALVDNVRLKKVRKATDDALAILQEAIDPEALTAQQVTLAASKQEILDALSQAGVERNGNPASAEPVELTPSEKPSAEVSPTRKSRRQNVDDVTAPGGDAQ